MILNCLYFRSDFLGWILIWVHKIINLLSLFFNWTFLLYIGFSRRFFKILQVIRYGLLKFSIFERLFLGFNQLSDAKLIHQLINILREFEFILLSILGSNPHHKHLKLQKSNPHIPLNNLNLIIKDILPHIVVERLTIKEHNFLMVRIARRYHFVENF